MVPRDRNIGYPHTRVKRSPYSRSVDLLGRDYMDSSHFFLLIDGLKHNECFVNSKVGHFVVI